MTKWGSLDRRWTTIILVLFVLGGVAFRIGWLATIGHDYWGKGGTAEAGNIARAIAEQHSFADSYQPGQGPTAHLSPISPGIAGGVYILFGYGTPLAEAVLTVWALAIVFFAFWLSYRIFEELGSPLWARLGAFGLLAIMPLNFYTEIVNFRIWEGGITVVIAGLYLLHLLRLDRRETITTGDMWKMALLAALCLLINPPTGLGAYAAGTILMVRKVPRPAWIKTVLIVAVTTLVVLTPWTVRNAVVMGRAIPFRSNLPIEMALANHDGMVHDADRFKAFTDHYYVVHPARPGGYARFKAAGGELPYFDQLARENRAWIDAHPGDFVYLCARHLVEFMFPPPWYWDSPGITTSTGSTGTSVKLAINWIASIFGLAGLAYGLWRVGRGYIYLTPMLLLPILPYMIVQPILRYRYIIFSTLVFLSFDLIGRLLANRSAARRSTASGS